MADIDNSTAQTQHLCHQPQSSASSGLVGPKFYRGTVSWSPTRGQERSVDRFWVTIIAGIATQTTSQNRGQSRAETPACSDETLLVAGDLKRCRLGVHFTANAYHRRRDG